MDEKRQNKKVKVGMVQINNSFSGQDYLPLSVGFLQAYAQQHIQNSDRFEFLPTIYKRTPVKGASEHLSEADIVAFSTYVWNFNISNAIAKRIKQERPETLIVFGGCHVPERTLESFLRENPHIDIAATDEGERPFKAILENFPNKGLKNISTSEKEIEEYLRESIFSDIARSDAKEIKLKGALPGLKTGRWGDISSINFLDENGNFVSVPVSRKIRDLNEITSPYLSGVFDEIMKENLTSQWIGLFETNRGCPFSCGYCDWGVGSKKRMANYNLERIFKEIDWFSENKIEFVYCCDANFGIYPDRDLPIAEKFAENKEKYGYPQRFSVQNTKNSTEESYKIQKVLVKAGLDKGVLLAFQSLNPEALKASKRGNIKLETFHELQTRFNKESTATFSDIILGLPEETYESFVNGVSTLIENGQHNRIQFNNLSILPNSEFGDKNFQQKYGFEIVKTGIVNMHGALGEWTDNIYETQELVVGTKSMPKEEWVKARSFGYLTSLLHFNKLLQLPFVIMNSCYKVPFREIINTFMKDNPQETPILSDINSFFQEKARDIQKGGYEYCHSEKWLNVFWYPDELVMINLASEGKIDEFYQQAGKALEGILNNVGINEVGPVREAISMNQKLLKLPFNKEDLVLRTQYNIWEAYRSGLTKENIPIKKGSYEYVIDRKSEGWDSWEEWCEKVVWWKNKNGAYLYSCLSNGNNLKNININ